MYLLKEFLQLIQEKDEEIVQDENVEKTIEDLFSEGDVLTYVSKELWDIRPGVEGERIKTGKKKSKVKKGDFVARNHEDLTNQKILSNDEFYTSFEPVRDNQRPDAEGYTLHHDVTKIEAIKYDGEANTLKDKYGQEITINNGEYITRYKDDPDTYFVLTSGDLKTNYKKSI